MINKPKFTVFLLALLLIFPLGSYAEEPALPSGLGGDKEETEEPALPSGLGGDKEKAEEPSLPSGLGEDKADSEKKEVDKEKSLNLPFSLTGFIEGRYGQRMQTDPYEEQDSIRESRLQLKMSKFFRGVTFKLTTDLLYDDIREEHDIELDEGKGWLDLREASFAFSPASFLDLKFGRQILTWGTGDMIFINDLFPKDWRSFFVGRDTEYLKAPSDAFKASFYTSYFNADIIYTPKFDHDRFIEGQKISFWNPMLGRRSGNDFPVTTSEEDDWFNDDEIALRLFKNIKGYEFALYGYHGYWKSPEGADPFTGKAVFPELLVYGASLRGAVGPGIGNIEIGYYDSDEDPDGDNPFLPNSEFRFLMGYEAELGKNFTVAGQYYLEKKMDYDEYESTLPPMMNADDKNRHLVTLRLTKLLFSQNLTLSLFGYYSPSDEDSYIRPYVHYKITDRWSANLGANIFSGSENHTFFGQFENNTNVYAGVRYSFWTN